MQPLNQWIIHKLQNLSQEVHDHLETYRFDWAAQALYQFYGDIFCDIYIECLKPLLGEDQPSILQEETRQTAGWILGQFLKSRILLFP